MSAFLLDVDNTLFDNDRFKQWCDERVRSALGDRDADRFWTVYEETRSDAGVVDYPATFERLRAELAGDARVAAAERELLDAPFRDFVFPGAFEVVEWLWSLGTVAILSDGDAVYQPLKIDRAGLASAVRGNVLVFEHKEAHLGEIVERFRAGHYVHVDDKASLLAASKARLHGRVTTVHVRQGHYADDPPHGAPPDVVIERIADLRGVPAERLLG